MRRRQGTQWGPEPAPVSTQQSRPRDVPFLPFDHKGPASLSSWSSGSSPLWPPRRFLPLQSAQTQGLDLSPWRPGGPSSKLLHSPAHRRPSLSALLPDTPMALSTPSKPDSLKGPAHTTLLHPRTDLSVADPSPSRPKGPTQVPSSAGSLLWPVIPSPPQDVGVPSSEVL